MEIGNLNVIKELAAQNKGISFMYQAAAQRYLENNQLSILKIKDFDIIRFLIKF